MSTDDAEIFGMKDLPNLSPFKLDATIDVERVEKVSRNGAPYTLVVVGIKPQKAAGGRTFKVEVFESLYRNMRALTQLQPDLGIQATEKPNGNGFTDIILSHKPGFTSP